MTDFLKIILCFRPTARRDLILALFQYRDPLSIKPMQEKTFMQNLVLIGLEVVTHGVEPVSVCTLISEIDKIGRTRIGPRTPVLATNLTKAYFA